MSPTEYNIAMAQIRAVLIAERVKAVVRWMIIAFYAYLLAEGIWYLADGWYPGHQRVPLIVMAPIFVFIVGRRLWRRIRREF